MSETRRAHLTLPAPLESLRVRSVTSARRPAGTAAPAPEPPRPLTPAEDPRFASAARALAAAAAELARRTEELERQAEPQLLALVKAIASEVIRTEVRAGHYDLAAIVRDALAVARGVERGAVVCLNPEDFGHATPSTLPRDVDASAVTLRADASVPLGGCRVETPFGAVTRDMAAALADVLAAVDGKR